METEKQELGHLVAAGIRFLKNDKGFPVHLEEVYGLHQDVIKELLTEGSHENGDVCLPCGTYRIESGNPGYILEIGKGLLGDKKEIRHLYLKKGTFEFVVGHSESRVLLREGGNIELKKIELQGEPSLGKLVRDVIQEAAGIPTIVTRGYKREQSDAAKSQGGLIVLPGYQLLESQQTQQKS